MSDDDNFYTSTDRPVAHLEALASAAGPLHEKLAIMYAQQAAIGRDLILLRDLIGEEPLTAWALAVLDITPFQTGHLMRMAAQAEGR